MATRKRTGKAGDNPTIEVEHATKIFGNRKAVDDVSFQIGRGEVVGFLGPNGAGKTTTMRMLTSYYTPDVGTVRITGVDTQDSDVETRKRIGYLPENNPLYGDLLVHEYLNFVADLRGLSAEDRGRNIDTTVDEVGLKEVYYLPVSFLSKGYRQRTGLAAAILHRPEILIMDEPTEGLDPNQRLSMRELIRSLGTERTVLLSTHVLGEIEGTCDRLLVIDRGKLIADDPVASISSACAEPGRSSSRSRAGTFSGTSSGSRSSRTSSARRTSGSGSDSASRLPGRTTPGRRSLGWPSAATGCCGS